MQPPSAMVLLSASRQVASTRVFIADTSRITVVSSDTDPWVQRCCQRRIADSESRGAPAALGTWGFGGHSGPPCLQAGTPTYVAVDAPGAQRRATRRLRALEHRERLGEKAEEPAVVARDLDPA